MATKEQYDFFVYLFEQEQIRHQRLEGRAKEYFAIVSLYLGALTVAWDTIAGPHVGGAIPAILQLLSMTLILGSLVSTALFFLMRPFEGIVEAEDVIKEFTSTPYSNEAFFDRRIGEFAVATERNVLVNNRAARCLIVASVLLVAGITVQAVLIFIGKLLIGGHT